MEYENCVTQGTIISMLQNKRAREEKECACVFLWRTGECILAGEISLHNLMIMGIHNGNSEVCERKKVSFNHTIHSIFFSFFPNISYVCSGILNVHYLP